MITIKQFRYSLDNLGYLVHGRRHAVAVDAGAARPMMSYLSSHGLELRHVVNTHMHPDHTSGNAFLLDACNAEFIPSENLPGISPVEIEGHLLYIHPTPGHTHDSVCFHIDGFLITGDTLFNGTVGNCFTGDLKGFYTSIKFLMSFPEDTVIFAGHDYISEAMAFAKALEPDNSHIDSFLASYNPADVHSTLRQELNINPYLRFNSDSMVSILKSRGLPVGTEYERWESVMSLG